MAKYSFEFKMQVVNDYLNGGGGYKYLAKKYHVPRKETLRTWVLAYKAFGEDGLKRSNGNKEYSFAFKKHVVELYLSSEISYQDLAVSQGFNNPGLVTRWVREFRNDGPDALKAKTKGRKKTLNTKDSKSKAKKSVSKRTEVDIDTSAEHVHELEQELLKLRIENAFLKELRRLRLEDEARMRELQESSVVSEDNSN